MNRLIVLADLFSIKVMMIMDKLGLTAHAIRSCWYQKDLSVESVKRYLDTFHYLMIVSCTAENLKHAGHRISSKNDGWRKIHATARNSLVMNPEFIPRAIDNLVTGWNSLTPEEIFVEFEEIHPYNDGNGRVGEILFYKLTGSFAVPSFN